MRRRAGEFCAVRPGPVTSEPHAEKGTALMSLPTDDEIRAVAEELGLLDERGQVPRDKRTQLAKVAVLMRDVPDDGDGPESMTTAQALSRLWEELAAEDFGRDIAADIILAAVPALIARDGLIIKENRTP